LWVVSEIPRWWEWCCHNFLVSPRRSPLSKETIDFITYCSCNVLPAILPTNRQAGWEEAKLFAEEQQGNSVLHLEVVSCAPEGCCQPGSTKGTCSPVIGGCDPETGCCEDLATLIAKSRDPSILNWIKLGSVPRGAVQQCSSHPRDGVWSSLVGETSYACVNPQQFSVSLTERRA